MTSLNIQAAQNDIIRQVLNTLLLKGKLND